MKKKNKAISDKNNTIFGRMKIRTIGVLRVSESHIIVSEVDRFF